MRATRAPREPRSDVPKPPPWEKEKWVDEGPLRAAAAEAADRASTPLPPTPTRKRAAGMLDPEVVAALTWASVLAKYDTQLPVCGGGAAPAGAAATVTATAESRSVDIRGIRMASLLERLSR